jgi:hypothetical protein
MRGIASNFTAFLLARLVRLFSAELPSQQNRELRAKFFLRFGLNVRA